MNLATGGLRSKSTGVVINGQVFSGTPGPISEVVGTLVCNPGEQTQVVLDAAKVALNKRGDARFSGRIQNVPEDCDNPLFLIRIATPAGAAGKWIAPSGSSAPVARRNREGETICGLAFSDRLLLHAAHRLGGLIQSSPGPKRDGYGTDTSRLAVSSAVPWRFIEDLLEVTRR